MYARDEGRRRAGRRGNVQRMQRESRTAGTRYLPVLPEGNERAGGGERGRWQNVIRKNLQKVEQKENVLRQEN